MDGQETQFGFVDDEGLQNSLKSDYAEMRSCLSVKAWKASQVLAGSIVEAVLIYWLQVQGKEKAKGKPLLKADLADLIDECKSNNYITELAANLSHVIRSYRNLIHAGVGLRTEQLATEESANTSMYLVNMVVKHIIAARKKSYGLTAEEIIGILKEDTSAIDIISHLLEKLHVIEKERLLCDKIPAAYLNLVSDETRGDDLRNLSVTFRKLFEAVGDEIRKKVVANYISMLRSSTSGRHAFNYEEAFFKSSDLLYADQSEVKMVLDRLFARLRRTDRAIGMFEGIGHYLTESNWKEFADPLLEESRWVLSEIGAGLANLIRSELHSNRMSKWVGDAIRERLNTLSVTISRSRSFEEYEQDNRIIIQSILNNQPIYDVPF